MPSVTAKNQPAAQRVSFVLSDGTHLSAFVRRSARAQRLRLWLKPGGQLELVVPQALGLAGIERALPQFLPWLERAWAEHALRQPARVLPERLDLPLAALRLRVELAGDMAQGRRETAHCGRSAQPLLVREGQQRLLLLASADALRLFGPVDATDFCALALRRWCRVQATRLLPPYLYERAAQADSLLRGNAGQGGPDQAGAISNVGTGLMLAGVCVRDQQSRWGSCARLRPAKPPLARTPPKEVRAPATMNRDPRMAWQEKKFHNKGLAAALGLATPWATLAARTSAVGQMIGQALSQAGGLASGTGPDSNQVQNINASPRSGADAGLAAIPAGRINLNWRALLLPLPLLEHLAWHELCHLRHMNHSPAYRAQLAVFSPHWQDREKALNQAWKQLPWWAWPAPK